jgi:hypothetical protein
MARGQRAESPLHPVKVRPSPKMQLYQEIHHQHPVTLTIAGRILTLPQDCKPGGAPASIWLCVSLLAERYASTQAPPRYLTL